MSRHSDLLQEREKNNSLRSDVLMDTVFPFADGDARRDHRHTATSESMSGLVQQVFLQQAQLPPRVVVFAGIDHGSGCSHIAAAVAATLAANAPRGVCLVEGNFRSPGLPALLGTTNAKGLTNSLHEEGPIWSFVKPTWNKRLWLLPSGPVSADSANLLNSVAMKVRSAELRKEFDFVVIDAPPLSMHTDAIALAQLSDGIVLVLEAEETRQDAALAVVERLRSSQTPILGAVLNKRIFPIPERIYRKL